MFYNIPKSARSNMLSVRNARILFMEPIKGAQQYDEDHNDPHQV
jgi:hypothetical protein